MYSFLVDDRSKHNKTNAVNKNVVATKVIINTKMLCLIINVWDIQWIEFKIKIIE